MANYFYWLAARSCTEVQNAAIKILYLEIIKDL
jgi:hypothetical protein